MFNTYNPYSPDLGRARQQELIAEGTRGRTAKAVRRAHRERRRGRIDPTSGVTT